MGNNIKGTSVNYLWISKDPLHYMVPAISTPLKLKHSANLRFGEATPPVADNPPKQLPKKGNKLSQMLLWTWATVATITGFGGAGLSAYNYQAQQEQKTAVADRFEHTGHLANQTNKRVQILNDLLYEKLDEIAKRTDNIENKVGSMNQNVQGAYSSLAELQQHLRLINNNTGAKNQKLQRVIDNLNKQLVKVSGELKTLDGQIVNPQVVAKVAPATMMLATSLDDHMLGSGSGFYVKDKRVGDYYIVTNHHVVDVDKKAMKEFFEKNKIKTDIDFNKPVEYTILPNGTMQLPATKGLSQEAAFEKFGIKVRLVQKDEKSDLAILKVISPPPGFNPQAVTIRDLVKDPLKAGEQVFAVGAPVGLTDSVSVGHISNPARQFPNMPGKAIIQTDAPINPGNSGGALFDSQGRLIGINEFIIRQMPIVTDGLGFSIRVDAMLDMLKKWGVQPG